MQRKTQLGIVIIIVALLLLSTIINFFGCAGTQPKEQELSPERRKAIQDSLRKEHERRVSIQFSLGWEPYKQGDYQRAKKYFRQVAELDTSGVYGRILYQSLGTCFLQLNQPDSAEWAYKLGIKNIPERPYPYKALAYIYRAQGRDEEAIEMYEILTNLEPDSATHYRSLGELYFKTEQPDNAILSYERVVELDPNDKQSQEILDTLLAQYRTIAEVIKQREAMAERFPDDMNLRLELAKNYHDIGEFEKAITHLKIVTEKKPENMQALEYLGDCYQQSEKFRDAVATYNQILKVNPDDKKNLCNMAISYTSLRSYRTAMQQVRKALSIDSNFGLAYLTRGMIYEGSADKCAAQKNGKVEYDDKLVYRLAHDEYVKATRDLEWKSEAERRIKYVESMLPTKEDEFFHNWKTPRGACYEWIQ